MVMIRNLFIGPGRCVCPGRSVAAPWRVLAALVAASVSMTAMAAGEERADIEPDVSVQAAIAQVADTEDRAQRQAAFERLSTLNETSSEQLVRQLAYFASRARSTRQTLAAGV